MDNISLENSKRKSTEFSRIGEERFSLGGMLSKKSIWFSTRGTHTFSHGFGTGFFRYSLRSKTATFSKKEGPSRFERALSSKCHSVCVA
jgi:hypothetical protein